MVWNILAMVEVLFNNKKLDDKGVEALEGLLRKQVDIDSLVVHSQGVTFYIWGKQVVDYKILDKLKARLEELGYHDFTIVANEFKEVARRVLKGE